MPRAPRQAISVPLQKRLNLRLKKPRRQRADMFVGNAPVAIHEERLRHAINPVVDRDLAPRIGRVRKGESEPLDEFQRIRLLVLDVHADHHQALVFELPPGGLQKRRLFVAGGVAPGRPEVQHHRLPLQTGEGDLPTAEHGQSELRRRLRDQGQLAGLLLQAAGFGIRLALPPLDFAGRDAVATTLANALVNACIQCAQRLQRAAAALTAATTLDARLEAAAALFGKGLVLVPAFAPRNAAQLHGQLSGDGLLRHGGPFAMDGFLAGAARVRDSLARLQQVWALGEAFGATVPAIKPAQLPEVAEDYWLGIAYPTEHTPAGDKLSLLVIDPDPLKYYTGSMHALLLDHWTEIIPAREETTGVSFFYDQPDATPPQALLLAVSPRPGGSWRWDDLVHTLHDTLEIARNRTVEPEHLDDTLYAQLLPAVLGELVPNRIEDAGARELAGSRAILDFGANN